MRKRDVEGFTSHLAQAHITRIGNGAQLIHLTLSKRKAHGAKRALVVGRLRRSIGAHPKAPAMDAGTLSRPYGR